MLSQSETFRVSRNGITLVHAFRDVQLRIAYPAEAGVPSLTFGGGYRESARASCARWSRNACGASAPGSRRWRGPPTRPERGLSTALRGRAYSGPGPQRKRTAVNDRARTRRRARAPASAIRESAGKRRPTGFALFDRDRRLVAANAGFAVLRGYPRKLLKTGTPVEAFVRFDVGRGEYGKGAIDALTRARLTALKRGRPAVREQALPDGRCVRIACERLADGGLLLICDQAVIAIENVRLFDEVQARTAELQESLEQQTATTEVLRVISTSPGALAPVFEAMLESATRSPARPTFGHRLPAHRDGVFPRPEADAHECPKPSPRTCGVVRNGPAQHGSRDRVRPDGRATASRSTSRNMTEGPAYRDRSPVRVAVVDAPGQARTLPRPCR